MCACCGSDDEGSYHGYLSDMTENSHFEGPLPGGPNFEDYAEYKTNVHLSNAFTQYNSDDSAATNTTSVYDLD